MNELDGNIKQFEIQFCIRKYHISHFSVFMWTKPCDLRNWRTCWYIRIHHKGFSCPVVYWRSQSAVGIHYIFHASPSTICNMHCNFSRRLDPYMWIVQHLRYVICGDTVSHSSLPPVLCNHKSHNSSDYYKTFFMQPLRSMVYDECGTPAVCHLSTRPAATSSPLPHVLLVNWNLWLAITFAYGLRF